LKWCIIEVEVEIEIEIEIILIGAAFIYRT